MKPILYLILSIFLISCSNKTEQAATSEPTLEAVSFSGNALYSKPALQKP